ncbi:MAG TPA: HAD-IB family hydrolase [Acidimicrobiales bacterium]|nr:HAD-IB family hydrolase [Acidimicrobiales bacterium]
MGPTPRRAAFFDLDKTVIAKASMVAFGKPFYRQGLISRRLLVRALWAQLVYLQLGASEEKLARVREQVLRLTRGWEQAKVSAVVRDTLDAVIEPIIYSEALELLEHHKAEGDLVLLVSASPEEIVRPLADYLGVHEVIASRAEIDDDGRYTGQMAFYSYGPYKAEAIHALAAAENLDLTASYAYSDSYTDMPMLECVGHPVVVNPDRVLLKLAREREWEVRQFVRPVRLRDRMPVPPARPTIAVVAGGALATAGALVWRATRPAPSPPSRGAARWLRRHRPRPTR